MRSLSGVKEPDAPADAIIWQPSVRLLLLFQKAVAEGGRSMVYECAQVADQMKERAAAGDAAGAKALDERLAFMTPILKGFLTEAGKEAADGAIQVYGGHGYIKDNGVEQVFRDVRIAPLWEGTTQIQALDLLGRKVLLQKLRPIHEHCGRLFRLCAPLLLSRDAQLRRHAASLLAHAFEWAGLTHRIAWRAARNREHVSSASVEYLMYSGYVTLAAHWLQMESAAVTALASGSGEEEPDFYLSKKKTSSFVFDRLLPRTRGLKAGILAPAESLTAMRLDEFSFDHSR